MVSFKSLLTPFAFLFATTFTLTSAQSCSYWLEDAQHQGIAAFNANPTGYQVFRNVKDFGAKGDGVTDDTAAINAAISSGSRCAPGTCASSSTSPALVYFPSGTYLVTAPIFDYYYTTIVGNPNCLPSIKLAPNFSLGAGPIAVIEADPYINGVKAYGATNVFWRGIRNLIIDMTAIPATTPMTGVHWPTGQATSLQNMVFLMSDAPGTQHAGVFIEEGSGGFMTDLTFYGGIDGVSFGNQQFTMRNLTFYNSVTAINQIWDWGWTYSGISINNCSVGLNMSTGGSQALSVGSINLIDSTITNTPIGIVTGRTAGSLPDTANTLILENVELNNVPVAVQGPSGTLLAGSSGHSTIAGWGQGHSYTPTGPNNFQGPITPNTRPASLLSGDRYYARSKPLYENLASGSVVSARSSGAKGDGKTDDTAALNAAIASTAADGQLLFLDHGDYLVTDTIKIPAGAKIAGEAYPVILSSGAAFNDINNPKPVVQVGQQGDSGTVELSDFIVSGQGPQAGAIMMEVNLASPAASPSGYWDVHTRIGGFAGSNLQLPQCAITPNSTAINSQCIAAFMSVYLTPSATGQYLENVWLWVADHDVEDPQVRQITIFAGRGLLDQSAGPTWLVGTAVEHHTLYQYQFDNADNVFAGQIQTETAYYQPNPASPQPFPANSAYNDPTVFDGPPTSTDSVPSNLTSHFSNSTTAVGDSTDGWGLRLIDSSNVLIYGAGHYSFFNNNNVSCSDQGNGERCQKGIVDIQGSSGKGNSIYSLTEVGTEYMFSIEGQDDGYYLDNQQGFVQTIGLFRP